MKQEDRPRKAKNPYSPPKLIEYGSVAKLTEAKGGSRPDGKSGMTMELGKGGACL